MLAERLAESGEPGRAVTVAQLVERILPYPLVRERLGLAGKAEYDLAVLRLLTDRVLLQLDPALHEAATKELDQAEPDLRPLEKLSESLLRVRHPRRIAGPMDAGGAGVASGDAGPEGASEEPAAASEPQAEPETALEPDPVAESEPEEAVEPGPTAEPEPEPVVTPEPVVAPEPVPPPVAGPPGPTECWSCSTRLPARDGVRFCPECGVDQQADRCVSCGDRLEPGWSFCPRCGRALTGP